MYIRIYIYIYMSNVYIHILLHFVSSRPSSNVLITLLQHPVSGFSLGDTAGLLGDL